jgi:hypothetical protein
MSNQCSSCKTYLGRLENYGNEIKPLCYECANNRKCDNCSNKIDLSNQIKYENKILCKNCYNAIMENKKDAIVPEPEEVEDTGTFAPERSFLKLGALGGLLLISISAVWFIIGYINGRIFFYPLILFILGLVFLIKGLVDRNFSGERTKELIKKEMELNEFKRENKTKS